MALEKYWANLANVISVGNRANAFVPLIILDSILIPVIFLFIYVSDDKVIRYSLVALIALLVIGSLIAYFIMLFKKPELLQTEHFRIEDKKLNMIAEKGSDFKILPVNLTTPTNVE